MWTSTLLSIFKCTAHFTTLNTQHNNYNFGTQAIYPTHLTATADQELKDGGHGDSLPSSLVMTKYSEVQNNKSMCWVHCAGLSLTHTHIHTKNHLKSSYAVCTHRPYACTHGKASEQQDGAWRFIILNPLLWGQLMNQSKWQRRSAVTIYTMYSNGTQHQEKHAL